MKKKESSSSFSSKKDIIEKNTNSSEFYHRILLVLGIIFAFFIGMSIVEKIVQNDAFFTISLGRDFFINGFRNDEFLTYHNEFSFYNIRWLFDLILTIIFDNWDFNGLYIANMITTGIISVIIFLINYKNTKNIKFSIFFCFLALFPIKYFFTSRAQILSIIIFVLQYYCSIELLKTNKKRYYVVLFILPILLVNIHGSIFPIYFIFFLPFVAEYIGSKIPKVKDVLKRLEFDNYKYYKQLMIVILISLFEGLLNPNGLYPYYMMFATSFNYSSKVISEMQPITIDFIPFFVFYFCIFFTYRFKQKAHNFFMLLGTGLMGVVSIRSLLYFFVIGSLIVCELAEKSYEDIEKNLKENTIKIVNSLFYILLFVIFICCMVHFVNEQKNYYVAKNIYPIDATNYLLEEVDLEKEVLFNDFNVGSFLEICGIKTFIDSRAEVFEKPINNTDILKDFVTIYKDPSVHEYKHFMNKYGFTIALVDKDSVLYRNITDDIECDYTIMYEDKYFVIYRIRESLIDK